MQGRRRITLYEQMSAVEAGRSLAGLTLDDILANHKREAAPTQPRQPTQRTLLDIIREDESNKKDRKTWKAFKDKLRLKRTGSAWTSSVHIPASDIPNPIQFNSTTNNSRPYSQVSRGNAVPLANSDVSTQHMDSRQVEDIDPTDPDSGPTSRPQFSSRVSSRYDPAGGDPSENKFKPSISRHNSTRMPAPTESTRRERVVTFRDPYDSDEGGSSSSDEEDLTGPSREVRTLSAREAVAAQEASEAAAAAQATAEAAAAAEAAEPVRMSLMDLLEETDRQMGLEGSMYCMGDYDSDYDDEEEEEEEKEEGTVEHNCCVCMVRHKGAAFIPCGHTFCRMCSRELWVSRGNCPLCNNFILEILDIF